MMQKNPIYIVASLMFFITACGSLSNINLDNIQIPNPDIYKLPSPALSQTEAASGLKEALINGASTGTQSLQMAGGFSQNAVYRILLPPEVQSLEQKIRNNALLNAAIGKELDKTIAAMNQGAELAAAKAFPIFKNAIQQMSFSDALKILTGGNGAATQFLKTNTNTQLTAAFQPEIKTALESVSLYQYWNPVVSTINKNKKILGLTADVQPNLETYVTEKAIVAIFSEVEIQENLIRKDPIKRSSELLKKVFNYADNNSTETKP
jgi:hypothetical protein